VFSDFTYRLRALFRRQTIDRELAEELEYHIERQVASLVQAGMSRADARRQALRTLGGIEQVKEECRDARGVAALEATVQDIQYGLRQLRRKPGFALVIVISLALGIGANTAIFTLIDAVLLRTLPIDDPAGLHFIFPQQPTGATRGFEYQEFRRLREEQRVFTDVAAFGTARLNVSVDGSVEPAAEGHLVSGSYFTLLGVDAIAGRTIGPADDRTSNGHPVAVISYGYWKRRFGLEPSIVGRTIHLSSMPFTIVGITPREFFGLEVGSAADIFVPITMQPAVMPAAENRVGKAISRTFWLSLVGRLTRDTAVPQATASLATLDVLDPLMTKPSTPGAEPQRIPEKLAVSSAATGISNLRQQFSQSLLILMAVVSIVLLIACANVANLVLARAASRLPEFSMRLALGAGRWRLVRQLLVENILLAAAGGLCGLFLAQWATGVLIAFMSSGRAPIVLDLDPDARILAFTAGVSILTGVLCGLVPAFRASRVDVLSGLKGHARGAIRGGPWLGPGKILVVSQVVLSLLLVFGAGLFVRSLHALGGQDGRFDRETVLVVRVEPRGSDQRGLPGASDRLDRMYRDLLHRVESVTGVRSASLAHYGPVNRVGYSSPLRVQGSTEHTVPRMMTYPHYFATMEVAMRAGRDFDDRDLAATAPLVGIVNDAFVRQIMNGENPIGRRVIERNGAMREIIGVVHDTRYASLKDSTPPVVYQPFLQTNTGRGQMTLHVRVAPGAADVTSRVREEVQRMDKDMPLLPVQTLAAELNGALNREWLVASLSTVFGGLALLLAAVGLYGLMAFSVVQRTGELGLRMALGATRPNVLRLILREALTIVVVGIAVGVPSALLTGRLASSQISGLLFGLSATDPLTMLGAACVLIAVATVAAYVPAARASQVDPMVALRND
jgi:predicted permease